MTLVRDDRPYLPNKLLDAAREFAEIYDMLFSVGRAEELATLREGHIVRQARWRAENDTVSPLHEWVARHANRTGKGPVLVAPAAMRRAISMTDDHYPSAMMLRNAVFRHLPLVLNHNGAAERVEYTSINIDATGHATIVMPSDGRIKATDPYRKVVADNARMTRLMPLVTEFAAFLEQLACQVPYDEMSVEQRNVIARRFFGFYKHNKER